MRFLDTQTVALPITPNLDQFVKCLKLWYQRQALRMCQSELCLSLCGLTLFRT